MRILLLNDTANNFHIGCEAVSNSLRRHIASVPSSEVRGIGNRVLGTVMGTRLDHGSRALVEQGLAWADLVIVNGEGTLHHDRAPELAGAIEQCIDARRPFAVVNSIFEDYPSLIPLLSLAEVVTLRDRASLADALSFRLPAQLCADAAIFGNFKQPDSDVPRHGVAVTDWHPNAPDVTHQASLRALADPASVHLPFRRADAVLVWRDAPNVLERFAHLVTGRYHAALLGLMSATPMSVLPSNSWKMPQLLRDLGILDKDLAEPSWPLIVTEDAARRAQDTLLALRASPQHHPLFGLGLSRRLYSARAVAGPFVTQGSLPDETAARGFADWFAKVGVSARERPKAHRALLANRADSLSDRARLFSCALLVAEGHAEQASWMCELISRTDPALAMAQSTELARAFPDHPAVLQAHANILAGAGHGHLALSILRKVVATGEIKRTSLDTAARLASSFDQWSETFALRRAWLSRLGAEASGQEILKTAVAASHARMEDAAVSLARAALAAMPPNCGWPAKHAAIILAANGAFAEGCRIMADQVRAEDDLYQKLAAGMSAVPPQERPRDIYYVSPEAGVGSAIIQLLPVLERRSGSTADLTIVVDERLHPILRRVFPDTHLMRYADDVPQYGVGNIINGYHGLEAFGARVDDRACAAVLAADSHQAATIRARYHAAYGTRPLVGLAWHTPNPRTSASRNLSTAKVRSLLRRHRDTLFVSLQPILDKADVDRKIIGCENLIVDTSINPLLEIDSQFSQIAACDAVLAIDCSAAFFAGALGKQTHVFLQGEPTWQWPQRKSFFAAHRIIETGPDSLNLDFGAAPQ